MITKKITTRRAKQWLAGYNEYLEDALGASDSTKEKYLFIAKRLLDRVRQRNVNNCTLTGDSVVEFVRWDTAPRRGQGIKVTVSAVRAFIRYLISQSAVQPGLDSVIPKVKSYSHASLPEPLSKDTIETVLSAAINAAGSTRRNYAMLILLARLGLRVHEVAGLQLHDVDWRNGTILIRSRKTKRERLLPLVPDVAVSMIDYLRHSRPNSQHRNVFLQHRQPYKPMRGNSVSLIVSRALQRVHIEGRTSSAHMFRHAVATSMVNTGTKFKDVADLLGHQSIQSTLIYAKLDMATLYQVALPWTGGDQ